MAEDDDELAKREWFERGLELARQHKSSQWLYADWYADGQQALGPGWCRALVNGPQWPGEKYSTLKIWASIARRYPPEYRYLNVAFSIYQEAAVMETLQERLDLLDDAARENWTVDQTRIEARMRRRAKPTTGADIVRDIDMLIGRGALFRALLADPPWRWEHQLGRRGAPTGHYPLMALAIAVPYR